MIRIHVKDKHIEHGWEGVCTRCPIALALKDQGYMNAWVDDEWIGLEGKESQVKYPIPRAADLFINDFDSGEPVESFNFVLVKKILPIAIDLG